MHQPRWAIMARRFVMPALAFGMTLAALPASAQQGAPEQQASPQPVVRFGYIDRDRDGFISAEETRRFRQLVFANLDTDGDGMVSLEEFAAAERAVPGPSPAMASMASLRTEGRFEDMDADKDGAVSKAEYLEAAGRAFARVEQAEDGKVSVQTYRSQLGAWAYDPALVGGGPDMTVAQADAAGDVRMSFAALDADGDSALSLDEWRATSPTAAQVPRPPVQNFAALDIDGDGRLTWDEFQNASFPAPGRVAARPAQPEIAEVPEPKPVWQLQSFE